MKKLQKKFGFTLIEILVATSIFAMAMITAMLTTVQINNLQYYNRLQQRLQEEARYAMEFINREAATANKLSVSSNQITIEKSPALIYIIGRSNDKIVVNQGNHTLVGGDVQVTDFIAKGAGTNIVDVKFTLKPQPRSSLSSNKSPYLGTQTLDQLQYTIQTTIGISD